MRYSLSCNCRVFLPSRIIYVSNTPLPAPRVPSTLFLQFVLFLRINTAASGTGHDRYSWFLLSFSAWTRDFLTRAYAPAYRTPRRLRHFALGNWWQWRSGALPRRAAEVVNKWSTPMNRKIAHREGNNYAVLVVLGFSVCPFLASLLVGVNGVRWRFLSMAMGCCEAHSWFLAILCSTCRWLAHCCTVGYFI